MARHSQQKYSLNKHKFYTYRWWWWWWWLCCTDACQGSLWYPTRLPQLSRYDVQKPKAFQHKLVTSLPHSAFCPAHDRAGAWLACAHSQPLALTSEDGSPATQLLCYKLIIKDKLLDNFSFNCCNSTRTTFLWTNLMLILYTLIILYWLHISLFHYLLYN